MQTNSAQFNCGDKAISVGEKSNINLNTVTVKNSNIGIASKDSSISSINEIFLENLNVCISAYNKKQEFSGSVLNIKKIECKNYLKESEIDNFSNIFVKNSKYFGSNWYLKIYEFS